MYNSQPLLDSGSLFFLLKVALIHQNSIRFLLYPDPVLGTEDTKNIEEAYSLVGERVEPENLRQ